MTTGTDKNALSENSKLMTYFSGYARMDNPPPLGDIMAMTNFLIEQGMFSPPQKYKPSFEEKMVAEDAEKEIRAKVTEYLKNNEGPTYHKDLKNGLTLIQVLDKIGLANDARSRGILQSVLRTENTGWGVVDYIGDLEGKDKKPVFGKKAVLISFRSAA